MEVGIAEPGDAGPLVIDWPVISVIIGGDGSSPAARHTAASVETSHYQGVVQIVTGETGEAGSPAEIANGHAGEARGSYLLMLVPGSTLDPRCIGYAVERIMANPSTVAVAFQWRRPDGRVLEAGSHLTSRDEITPLFRGGSLPGWLTRAPYSTHVSTIGSLLIRSQEFFVAGGFNLELDGSPYQAAHLALSLTAGGGNIEVEPRAVAFAPPEISNRHHNADLIRGRNLLQTDFAAGLDQLHFQFSIDADLSVLLSRQQGTRVLWVATHIPDATRSGVDARHLEMIRALVDGGNEVVVWAVHTDGADARQLEALGVRWVARTQSGRWDLRPRDEQYPWLQELVRQVHWDHVIISEPTLVSRISPLIRELSPDTAVVVDLGTVRFPAAHTRADGNGGDLISDLPDISDADAVVVATGPDLAAVRDAISEVPACAFTALGEGEPGGAAPGGDPLFIGNLLHRPNAQALEWWIDAIASRVEARLGRPIPLRVVGHGSEIYRGVWNHPAKIDLAGWQQTLAPELSAARMLVVPLPYATGTGSRIAAALSHGLPVVASSPAAAMLAPELRDLVSVGATADEVADQIALLMRDDDTWQAARGRLAALDFGALRTARRAEFGSWLATVQPATNEPALTATPRSGNRRARRRRLRAS